MQKFFFRKLEFWSGIQVDFIIGDFENFLIENKHFFNLWIKRFSMFLRSFSYQTFWRRFLCVGGTRKTSENRNKLHLFCEVINDVSLMSHTSSESPWSKISEFQQTKCGDHVVALQSEMSENLKLALARHLVDQFRWQIPSKVGNFLEYYTVYIMTYKRSTEVELGQIVELGSNL